VTCGTAMAVQAQQHWSIPLRAGEDTVTHEVAPRARPLSVGPSTNGIAPCMAANLGSRPSSHPTSFRSRISPQQHESRRGCDDGGRGR
jgi:hypothetical protein